MVSDEDIALLDQVLAEAAPKIVLSEEGDPGEHCTPQDLLRLSDGALDDETARMLRRHLLYCDMCGNALITQAARQVSTGDRLTESVQEPPPQPAPRRFWRGGILLLVPFVFALSGAWFFFVFDPVRQTTTQQRQSEYVIRRRPLAAGLGSAETPPFAVSVERLRADRTYFIYIFEVDEQRRLRVMIPQAEFSIPKEGITGVSFGEGPDAPLFVPNSSRVVVALASHRISALEGGVREITLRRMETRLRRSEEETLETALREVFDLFAGADVEIQVF